MAVRPTNSRTTSRNRPSVFSFLLPCPFSCKYRLRFTCVRTIGLAPSLASAYFSSPYAAYYTKISPRCVGRFSKSRDLHLRTLQRTINMKPANSIVIVVVLVVPFRRPSRLEGAAEKRNSKRVAPDLVERALLGKRRQRVMANPVCVAAHVGVLMSRENADDLAARLHGGQRV